MSLREICWNRGWQFAAISHEDNNRCNKEQPFEFISVVLPHTCKELPFDCFDERVTLGHWLYRKDFSWEESFCGKRVALRFDGVMCCAEVTVNGKTVAKHEGGFTPFIVELTDALIPNRTNRIEVWVDSTENPKVAPFGGVMDYLTFGGIYRDVTLIVTEPEYITSFKIWGENLLTNERTVAAAIELCPEAVHVGGTLELILTDKEDQKVFTAIHPLEPGKMIYRFSQPLPAEKLTLWSVECPVLYRAEVVLKCKNGHIDRLVCVPDSGRLNLLYMVFI